tara:strand:- start:7418 stop:7819 length:402 start_codon:yes stop_codon:yes gene_type:complete
MRSTAKRKIPIKKNKTQGGTCIQKPSNLTWYMHRILLLLLLLLPYRAQAQQLLPQDKLLHLGGSYVIGATATSIAYYYTRDKKTATIIGVSAVLLAGLGKELWDIKYGNPEINDLAADITGGTLGILTVKINF